MNKKGVLLGSELYGRAHGSSSFLGRVSHFSILGHVNHISSRYMFFFKVCESDYSNATAPSTQTVMK